MKIECIGTSQKMALQFFAVAVMLLCLDVAMMVSYNAWAVK